MVLEAFTPALCATVAPLLLLGTLLHTVRAARRARAAKAGPADPADDGHEEFLDVLPQPIGAVPTTTHIFVSHAGEQKANLVDHIRTRFKEKYPALRVFVDEWSLEPGDRAMERIWAECRGARIGVLILSKEFVRKRYCMAELRILLDRWEQASKAARDSAQQQDQTTAADAKQQVQLLPVLYRLQLNELTNMLQLYGTQPWCVDDTQPGPDVLKKWVADLQRLTEFTLIRPDQWRGDAELVAWVVERAVQQLADACLLPEGVKPTLNVVKCAASPSGVALVGREQQLEQGLRALHQQRYVEIRGAPGEGKSTLAQHLVAAVCHQWEQLPEEEAGGQVAYALEVNLAGLQESVGGVEAAVAMLLLSAVGAVTMAQQAAQGSLWRSLLGWLGQQACTVIVFDNTEAVLLNESTAEAFQPMIKQLLSVQRAGVHRVRVVVATRAGVPSVEGTDDEASVITLQRLSEEEGMQLLKAHLPESGHVWRADEERAARQLVQLAECNPLALSVAAGLVKAKDLKWQDLVDKQKLADLRPIAKHKPGGMGRQIQQLREWLGSCLDEADLQLLATVTVFPGSFTVGGAAAVTGSMDAEALLDGLAWTSLLWQRAVGGISIHNGSQEEKRYSLHALVREAAEALHVDSSKDKLVRSLTDWMLLDEQGPGQVLLRVEPEGPAPDMLMFWYILREEVANLSAAADGLGVAVGGEERSGSLPLLGAADGLGVAVGGEERSGGLPLLGAAVNVGRHLSMSGLGLAAKQLHQSAAMLSKMVLGAEHTDTLTSMNNLASTLKAMGELGEARQLHEEVLEVRTRVLGAEHPDTLTSMNNLASTLQAMGELGEAKKLQEEVLEVRTRVLGAEHPSTLTIKSNLAGILQAMGELGKARKLQEEELVVCTRVVGAEHPDTLTSMNNLASTLWAMGELGEARQQEEEVLEVRTRVLGAEHPDTLTSRNNLASTLRAMGELGAARQQEEEVLEVRTKVLGAEHPDTLTSMSNLASTLWAMGELGEARRLQEEVLVVRNRVLGAEHPATLTSMNNLASTLLAMGELGDARKLQEVVLEVRTRVLGAEHPGTLTTMNNLAITLRTMGELRDARQLQEEQHRVCKRVLGAQHPHTLSSENNLAIILQAMGELWEAPAPGNSS